MFIYWFIYLFIYYYRLQRQKTTNWACIGPLLGWQGWSAGRPSLPAPSAREKPGTTAAVRVPEIALADEATTAVQCRVVLAVCRGSGTTAAVGVPEIALADEATTAVQCRIVVAVRRRTPVVPSATQSLLPTSSATTDINVNGEED